MNKLLAIILFPIIWMFFYLYRIIWYDIVGTAVDIFSNLFISPLSSLWLLITFPIVLIFEIPIGLLVTLISAFAACSDIFTEQIDFADAIKSRLAKNNL